ncbi:hypothetical protein BCR32DRAFT_287952 [Anaeromyces robustus]|uniref:Uncharacterized protein n=1 Tax=Anaeromyces robustus TaxID=1754192 RepID=A0A1Y1VQC2_9FUNG|nr:hypothetical protein BCR32DRAFT_287952 [Anaeromyces robustus]|eukprot:ORX62516.1 hypothetical protein BCR32DRAFT_287952 [Anaeromyces robustus]
MKYLAIKNETNDVVKIKKIYDNHSFVKVIKDTAITGEYIQVKFFPEKEEEKEDGIDLEIGKDSILQIKWDYKDLADYYPVPLESSGEYVLVRENTSRRYRFLIINKEKAGEIVRLLLARGENFESIQQQVSLSANTIKEMSYLNFNNIIIA